MPCLIPGRNRSLDVMIMLLLKPIRALILWITIPLLFVSTIRAQEPTIAYTLDTSGISNKSEKFLVGALAGIVNRDAPRLFMVDGTPSGNKLVEYLETQKNFRFQRFRSLNDAIAFFPPSIARMASPD
jgi:hypothetical protein